MGDPDHATNSLTASYQRDDQWIGQLLVTVAYDGFAGHGSAWFNADEIIAFAVRLTQYPLGPDPEIRLSSGLGADSDYKEFVGLTVEPRGGKGQVVVHVHLAHEEWRDGTPVMVHQTRVEFLTSYEYLGRFGRHLEDTVRGHLAVAELASDVLV